MRTIRRLVTGHDAEGQSMLLHDGDAENITSLLPQVPDFVLINLWRTDTSPATIVKHDAAAQPFALTPSTQGSIFRIVDFPPEAEYLDQVTKQLKEKAFADIGAEAFVDRHDPSHPFMHCTQTIDYALVLEGEIFLVLDKSEHLMRAGDVAVQAATNHAWSNRSDKICRMAFILLDAKNEKEGERQNVQSQNLSWNGS